MQTFFTFFVGLAGPIYVLVKTEPPTSLRAWEEACEQRGDPGDSPSEQHPGALQRLEAALEAAVRQLCGRSWLAGLEPSDEERIAMYRLQRAMSGGRPRPKLRLRLQGWERLLAWWLIFALVWALSVAAATSRG